MTDAYQTYRQLVQRVEAFAQAIRQRYPTQITCHAGCDGCCYQHFTVFPVESQHLASAVAALSPHERQRLRRDLIASETPLELVDQPQLCVLLEDGRCRLYAGRPLICRMHGYPLFSQMIEREEGGKRDCCPLNFTGMPLEEIETQAVFNLDLTNQTLASINHLFVQEHDGSDQRIPIRQAVLQALDAASEIDGKDAERT
ncbi:MAG: YkgJ family cysteine cluster protein [Candidatus Tectomicrobia bacterium]|nr:YkgJ family cysteine cluster protein [Candidatus Tectomicrobia bacterium]